MEEEEFKVQRMCTINKIEIDNPELWEVSDNQALKDIIPIDKMNRANSMDDSTSTVNLDTSMNLEIKKTLVINEIV